MFKSKKEDNNQGYLFYSIRFIANFSVSISIIPSSDGVNCSLFCRILGVGMRKKFFSPRST